MTRLTPSPCRALLDDPEPARRDQNPSPKNKANQKIPGPNHPQHAVNSSTQSHNINKALNIPPRRHPPPTWIPNQPLNSPFPTPFHTQITSPNLTHHREAQDSPVLPRHGIPILHPLGPASAQSTPPRPPPSADNNDDDDGSQTRFIRLVWTLKSCPSQAGTRNVSP